MSNDKEDELVELSLEDMLLDDKPTDTTELPASGKQTAASVKKKLAENFSISKLIRHKIRSKKDAETTPVRRTTTRTAAAAKTVSQHPADTPGQETKPTPPVAEDARSRPPTGQPAPTRSAESATPSTDDQTRHLVAEIRKELIHALPHIIDKQLMPIIEKRVRQALEQEKSS